MKINDNHHFYSGTNLVGLHIDGLSFQSITNGLSELF